MLRKICSIWAFIYLYVVMLGLPLYYEDQYFNLLQAKNHYFVYVGGIMLGIGLILYIFSIRKELPKALLPKRLFKNPLDIAVGAFVLIGIISTFFSISTKDAFWGTRGWCIGSFCWILLALSYFLISRCLTNNVHGSPIFKNYLWIPVILINIGMIVIAVFHAAGVDLLNLHVDMYETQVLDYYSTFGQMNWWVPYLCLFAPMTAIFITTQNTLRKRILLYIFWAFLCIAMLISASDGLFIGLGLCMFFVIPFVFQSLERLERSGIIIAIFGICGLLFSVLPCFSARITKINKGIFKYMTTPLYCALFLAAGLLVFVIAHIIKIKSAASFTKIRRILILICELILVSICLYFIISTIKEFDDSWGTKRGLIWRMSIELFGRYDFKNKLIGIGPEMLRTYYKPLSEAFGQTVLVSHSEPLQYLLTTGVLGLISWLGIWASVIIMNIKKKARNPKTAAFFIPLMAYLGQSLVNSAMTTNLVMLFIFLAFFAISNKAED